MKLHLLAFLMALLVVLARADSSSEERYRELRPYYWERYFRRFSPWRLYPRYPRYPINPGYPVYPINPGYPAYPINPGYPQYYGYPENVQNVPQGAPQ